MSTSQVSFKLITDANELENLLDKLEECKLFAFDCESVDLGRTQPVTVLNICLEDGDIFLVDIQVLGGISDRLKALLENDDIKKVMFDCRADADSLWHEHKVKLHGIEDFQIMQYVVEHRDTKPAKRIAPFPFVVHGYLGKSQKERLFQVKVKDYSAWGRRPLQASLLEYAAFEISMFFPVRNALLKKCSKSQEEIQEISEKYAEERRANVRFVQGNPYHAHGFMPIGVMEPANLGDKECTKCNIKLHESEFNSFEIRNGNQKCIVCKAVEQNMAMRKYRGNRY